jgi:hypothetical protein
VKKKLSVIVLIMWSCNVLFGQETWVKSLGGGLLDVGNCITATPDGGYVLTGGTYSDNVDFKGMNNGDRDIFFIKLDSLGNVQQKKTFGGSRSDDGVSVITTLDGGYVLTGETYSIDGDFKGINKETGSIFIIKIDSRATIQWKRTFGGSEREFCNSITATPDGGYILSGGTESNDRDFVGSNRGGFDIFVIKLDQRGEVQWKKYFGGSQGELGHSITSTSDGGYVLTGYSGSNDGDFEGMNKGVDDIIVIKIDSLGNVLWKKTYGGEHFDQGNTITLSPDDGYVLTGWTRSNEGDFTAINEDNTIQIFVMKLDPLGDVEWKRVYDGSETLAAGRSITTTPDGGYVLTGETLSYEVVDDESYPQGYIFVLKLDQRGDILWKRRFGGKSERENSKSIATTHDGGYILTGSSDFNTDDFKRINLKSKMNKGGGDIFVIKLDKNGTLQPAEKNSRKR